VSELEFVSEVSNSEQTRIDALFDIKRFQHAEELIRKQLSLEPEDAFWLYYLARAQFAQDNSQGAADSLVSSLHSDSDYSWSYYLLSFVNHNLLNFSQELECAKKCAELEPEETIFLQRLAEAQIQSGEIKNAKTTLQQVLKLEPDSEEAFQLLGDIEFELGNFLAAETAYRQALKFSPEDVQILNDLARSLISQKNKYREGIDVFYNIVQLDPLNEVITQNLHLAIREWLDNKSFKGKRKEALKSLPEPLQYFYKDYKSRASIFEAWGSIAWATFWIVVLAALTLVFSTINT